MYKHDSNEVVLTCYPKFEPKPELDYNINYDSGGFNEKEIYRGTNC
jgi:hypothetical protein